MNNRRLVTLLFFYSFTLSACNFGCTSLTPSSKESKQAPLTTTAEFDENYAFDAILTYEKFGPKVPGSSAHQKTGDWIVSELKKYGVSVLEQKVTGITHDQKKIPMRNIIGQINPSAQTRYLLSAHWDNRHMADQDTKNKDKPIVGTNDGGSGVVVLLGIAKAYSDAAARGLTLNYGVDFAFWDAEDGGHATKEEGWCLGSQYWAKNPVPENYQAKYGINFDMVGRIGSVFPVEYHSMTRGSEVLRKLRVAATSLGYQDSFPNYQVGPIIDDHFYVMQGRNFPMVDLIYMTPEGMFPPEWHTHRDTSDVISRDVLKVVGQTTIQTLANE